MADLVLTQDEQTFTYTDNNVVLRGVASFSNQSQRKELELRWSTLPLDANNRGEVLMPQAGFQFSGIHDVYIEHFGKEEKVIHARRVHL